MYQRTILCFIGIHFRKEFRIVFAKMCQSRVQQLIIIFLCSWVTLVFLIVYYQNVNTCINCIGFFKPMGAELKYGGNSYLNQQLIKLQQEDANNFVCKLPVLDPFNPDIMKIYHKFSSPLGCDKSKYGVIKNGVLYIKAEHVNAVHLVQITRGEDDFEYKTSKEIEVPFVNGTRDIDFAMNITGDFYKLKLDMDSDDVTEFLAYTKAEVNTKDTIKIPPDNYKLNILFLIFDSQSNANFRRSVPRTLKVMDSFESRNISETTVFYGQSIVGDGTAPQMAAILADHLIHELPNAKKGDSNAKHVDRWPFLFDYLKHKGYTTLLSEDDGTYDYEQKGFENPPTDHYARHFWLATEDVSTGCRRCVGDQSLHQINLDYVTSMFETYGNDTPKFGIGLMSRLAHNDAHYMQLADDSLADFLELFRDRGYLNKTALILMGDHGNRVASYRQTTQGKLEERMPYVALTLPKWFLAQDKDFSKNLQHNSRILTSHFDLYPTLKHLIDYPKYERGRYGQSLLTWIDETRNRSCRDIGVARHYCPCTEYVEISKTTNKSIVVAKYMLRYMNELLTKTEISTKLCSRLELKELLHVRKKVVTTNKLSNYIHNIMKGYSSLETFEVVLQTTESNGIFEGTVYIMGRKAYVDPNISRLNRYGDQPSCIMKDLPSLRKYCYCR